MKRYEYKFVVSGNEAFREYPDDKLIFDGGLNDYGQEGWEAVGIDVKNSMIFTLLKREISDETV